MYIVAFTYKSESVITTDGYERIDNLEDAQDRYREILNDSNLETLSLAKEIDGTDY